MYPRTRPWRPLALLGVFVSASLLATSTVEVQAGDTLSEIAARHDVAVAQLAAWNDIDDPDRIFAGDTLVLGAPARPSPTTDTDNPTRYTVAPGDTLGAIAHRFGSSIARLSRINDIDDPDLIIAGQRLVLRGDDDAGAATTTTTTTTTAPSISYTVVAGDTLSSIAARHGVKTGVLARDNGIADADRIVVGQTLTIGVPAPPTATPTPTTTQPDASPDSAPPPTPTTTTVPTTTTRPPAQPGGVLLSTLFVKWADAYDVSRDLLEAVAWKESDWRADAVGPNGHLGIAQLSPETIEFVETGLLGREMDPLNASDGLQMAARYLRYILDRTNDEREALAAWHQGLRSVQQNGISAAGGAYADAVLEIRRQRG